MHANRSCSLWTRRHPAALAITTAYRPPPGIKSSLRRASPALDPGRRPNSPTQISTEADFNFNACFSRMQISTLDRVSQMAMVAGDEAVASARLGGMAMGPRGGVLFGTGMGGAESLEAGYAGSMPFRVEGDSPTGRPARR